MCHNDSDHNFFQAKFLEVEKVFTHGMEGSNLFRRRGVYHVQMHLMQVYYQYLITCLILIYDVRTYGKLNPPLLHISEFKVL